MATTSQFGKLFFGCLAIAAFVAPIGCAPKKSDPTASTPDREEAARAEVAPPPPADSEEAVAKLSDAGFALTMNDDGNVISVSVDRRGTFGGTVG